jgi:hypothetical protein
MCIRDSGRIVGRETASSGPSDDPLGAPPEGGGELAGTLGDTYGFAAPGIWSNPLAHAEPIAPTATAPAPTPALARSTRRDTFIAEG